VEVVVWRWWIVDERTGKRRLTKWHITEADALGRYSNAEREASAREERHDPGSAAAIVTQGCAVCHGSRWVCEDDRTLPWQHDGCSGAGPLHLQPKGCRPVARDPC